MGVLELPSKKMGKQVYQERMVKIPKARMHMYLIRTGNVSGKGD